MIHHFKKMIPLAFAAIILSSCAESKTSSEEEIQIKSMDSTSKAVKETNDKLEDQTKKVEASLEKLDAEFKPDNQ